MGGSSALELRIAIAEGLLTAAEADALREEAARAGQGVLERLREEGRISGETFASLRARVGEQEEAAADPDAKLTMRAGAYARTWKQDPARAAGSPDLPADDPDAFPVPGWDRYEPIRLLGKGGMGRVFLAKDLRLGRNVAIKFVRGDDPELARRIVAEARAQARVNDDRVCKVYEVGEVRGRVYITMQHIDGQPLSELIDELTVEQKAIVMRGAALGIAEAHRAGLIHRDVKPSNIMVERGEAGELRPYVMDFGLARDWADGTTATGTVLGTPQFMPPEQALGEVKQLDRRADVYSLGATLYALLTSQAPVTGGNPLEILARVVTAEPPRPRSIDPDVPADLEAIAMKCLEKERAARYDSARALADDLGRFLAGEPVAARASAGVGYRLRKALRRHRRLVAVAAAAVVLAAVALGFNLRERRRAEQRETLARRFTERVERIEASARYAALARAHDLRPGRAELRRELDALAAEVRAAGDLAAGPGHYALGRGHLALGDEARAATELAAAWELGVREPRVAYARALAEGRLYRRALREVERLPKDLPAELRERRRREVEQRHREPALRYLRASGGPDVPSPAYVAALIAFYEDRFDDALARLDAIGPRAWFYEASLLRGEVLRARARRRMAQGAMGEAAADLEAGRRALEAAAAAGESDPAVHAARGELEWTTIGMELYGSGAVDAPVARGIDAAGKILALLPDDADALALRARFLRALADHRNRRGEDTTEPLTRAAADAQRALALAPDHREVRLELASIYRQWGEIRHGRGLDPSEQLARAVEIAGAIPEADRDAVFYLDLGLVHTVWADHEEGSGRDPSAHRQAAIDAFARAVRINDRLVDAWLNLGNNYASRASVPGGDADGDLAKALEALSRGRSLDPSNSVAYLYEGNVYALIAGRKAARGVDPDPDHTRAIELYARGSALSPSEPAFPNAICAEHMEQAQAVRARGGDPLPFLDRAEAAARKAVATAPDQGFGHSNVGDVLSLRAACLRERGDDPIPAARAAEAAFTQALERLPEHPTIWMNLATLHVLVAGVELDRRRDPRARLALARAAVDRAVALNPDEDGVAERRDEIQALLGRWRRGPGSGAGTSQ